MGCLALGSLVATPCSYHHLTVATEAGRRHDGRGESGPACHQDEVDGVDLVPWDAPVQDDRRDVVLVQVESPVETRQRGRSQAGDVVLRQSVHPALDDLGEVVGEQDEGRRCRDLPGDVVAGHDGSLKCCTG